MALSITGQGIFITVVKMARNGLHRRGVGMCPTIALHEKYLEKENESYYPSRKQALRQT